MSLYDDEDREELAGKLDGAEAEIARLTAENARLVEENGGTRRKLDDLVRAVHEFTAWHVLAVATFVNDPPDSDFQQGYLAALTTIADEHLPPLVAAHNAALAATPDAQPGENGEER